MEIESGDHVRLKRDPIRGSTLLDAEKNVAGQCMVLVGITTMVFLWRILQSFLVLYLAPTHTSSR